MSDVLRWQQDHDEREPFKTRTLAQLKKNVYKNKTGYMVIKYNKQQNIKMTGSKKGFYSAIVCVVLGVLGAAAAAPLSNICSE